MTNAARSAAGGGQAPRGNVFARWCKRRHVEDEGVYYLSRGVFEGASFSGLMMKRSNPRFPFQRGENSRS